MTARARRLTAGEEHDLAAARLHAAHRLMPYLATAVFRLHPFAVDDLGTFAVDARWRLFVDPVVMRRWGVRATAGVLLHEVGHALRDHAGVAAREGPGIDRHAFNLCADAAINDDLVESGVPLPGGHVLPGHLHDRAGRPMPVGWTAQRYYAELPRVEIASRTSTDEQAHERPLGGPPDAPVRVEQHRLPQTSASCGEVAGGDAHDVTVASEALDGDERDGGGISTAEQRLVRRAVAAAIARGAVRGDVPAGLRRWADDELAPPSVPWQQQLRAAVRRGVASAAGHLDTTYARPSRRRVPGVVLPGTRRPVPTVAVVVDTSASMDDQLLAEALAEVEGIARASSHGGRRIAVITVDAAVHTTASVGRARDVVLRGGGGTDLRPGLHAAVRWRAVADVVVVLTDGFTPWPAAPPRTATSWIVGVLGDGDPPAPPAWARVVRIGAAGVAT